jgi:hypothetical protein
LISRLLDLMCLYRAIEQYVPGLEGIFSSGGSIAQS